MKTLVCCAVISACFAAFPRPPADGAVLLAADRAFNEDTAADGLEGWLRWFAPETVIRVPSGELLRGADERRAWYGSADFPPPGFSWSPESGALAESGDLGYTVGTWQLRAPGIQVNDEAEVPGGNYLTIWQRQPDGSYRVITDGGGRTDFRTRFERVPDEWSTTTEWSKQAASGEYRFVVGSWTSRVGDVERQGHYITVWEKSEDGSWEIAAETSLEG